MTALFRRAVRMALGLDETSQIPCVDLMAFYRARVDVAAADGSTVDVTPEDKRIEAAQGVPLRIPFPGKVIVQPGAYVLVGWERGDPERMYASPMWEAGAGVVRIEIGGGDYWLLKTDDFLTDLINFFTACSGTGAIVVGNTGVPTAPFSTYAATILGKLQSGAYKSTKVKNG